MQRNEVENMVRELANKLADEITSEAMRFYDKLTDNEIKPYTEQAYRLPRILLLSVADESVQNCLMVEAIRNSVKKFKRIKNKRRV